MRRALLLLMLLLGLLAGSVHGAAALPTADPGGGSGDDTTPPQITVTRPAGAIDGWHKEPARIFMTVSDSQTGGSGVSRASYTLSGATTGSGSFSNNQAELQISNEGSTRIDVEAWDRADNRAEATHWVGVDTTAPTITLETEISGRVFARGQQVPVTYRCTDAHVGVDTCTAPIASGANLSTQQIGQFAFHISTRDRLGNARLHQVSYTVVEPYFAVVENPRIAGEAKVGEQVNATAPHFSPSPDRVEYQWRRAGQPIAGETTSSYVIQPEDAGKDLTVTATAHKTGFQSAVATSARVTPAPGTFQMAVTPRLTGTARVEGELTVHHSLVGSGSTRYEYRWFRGEQRVAVTSGRTYRPTSADLGSPIFVEVAASAPGYESASWRSEPTAPVATAGPVPVSGATSVTGVAKVASVLTARPASFGSGATLRYQWLRNGSAIKGATSSTYRLQPADRGTRISVRVTGSRAGYTSSVSTSTATKAVVKAVPRIKASAAARGKRAVRVTVAVTSAGVTPTGKVTIKRGSTVVARGATLRGGKVTVNLSRQKKGRATYTVVYGGSSGFTGTSVKARTIRVR